MMADVSNQSTAADIVDAEIRNSVEGFESELNLALRAEAAASLWFEGTFGDTTLGDDEHIRMSLIAAFIAGSLSMARELGYLPEGGAA